MPLIQPAPSIGQGLPDVTLLTSASPLPPEVRDFDRWRSGLGHRSVTGIVADSRTVCATGNWAARAAGGDTIEFFAVEHGTIHGCEGLVDEAAYTREAVQALDDKLPYLVARELWAGGESGNPSLQSTATSIGGSGDITNVCAYLIANMEETLDGGRVTLHVPSLALPGLLNSNFVTRVGSRLLTPTSHVVVPGPGYPSSPGLWGPDGSIATEDGQVWVYATGPVEVALEPDTRVTAIGGGLAARRNSFDVWAQRFAIARFDTATVLAGLCTIETLV